MPTPDLRERGIERTDVTAWRALLDAVETVDDTGEHVDEEDLLEELDDPELTPGADLVGLFEGDRMVGFWGAVHRGETGGRMRVHAQGATHPARRGEGLGSRLVESMLARADALHAARAADRPLVVFVKGRADDEAQADLLASVGMRVDRWSLGMQVDLAVVPPAPPVPEGYAVLPYSDELDEPMRRAHNEAFLDHPNFAPWGRDRWDQWVTTSRSFRRDLSRVVVSSTAPAEVVAYIQADEFTADLAATGRRELYVGKVGTLREHRGRGLAGLLLRTVLEAGRDAGMDTAALDVDSDNPTGALGIYEGAGFRVRRRFADYALEREPVDSSSASASRSAADDRAR